MQFSTCNCLKISFRFVPRGEQCQQTRISESGFQEGGLRSVPVQPPPAGSCMARWSELHHLVTILKYCIRLPS